MVQQGKDMSQHNETMKIMRRIKKGLGVIGITPSGGSTKLAKLLCREKDEGEKHVIVVAPS
jgi:23S rRNA pseudoU1915 N3-methylase RlmH